MLYTSVIKFLKNYKSTIIILLSVFFGILTGVVMGKDAKILLPLGDIFINLTFTIVTPLIFFSVSSSIANIITLSNTKRTILSSIFVFLLMSSVATIFMLIVVKLFPVIGKIDIPLIKSDFVEEFNITDKIASIFTVSDFNKILTKNAMLPLMIFSVLFGLAVKLSGEKGESIKKALSDYAAVMFKMIDFLMYYAPIGLFAYFAAFFGSSAEHLIGPLAKTVLIFYLISVVFGIIFYVLYAYISAGYEGIKSLKFLLIPAATAFATRSSLATVPAEFEAASSINVPKNVSNLTLPLGSIIFLDGSSLSSVLKIAFLFVMFSVPMTGITFYFGIFLFSIFVCLLSSGVPGGGMVLEIAIITMFGFPVEALPILILLNFLIDPIVTVLNATGNIVGTMLISRIVKGKGWIFRKELEEDSVLKIYK